MSINLKYPIYVEFSYLDDKGNRYAKALNISLDMSEEFAEKCLKHLLKSANQTQNLTEEEKCLATKSD